MNVNYEMVKKSYAFKNEQILTTEYQMVITNSIKGF